ncbi:MAG: DMT family transporter [Pseudomonadota bacterium]
MGRLIALTALTMVAFAANSVLNRTALVDGSTAPAAFAAVRLVSGAIFLSALVLMRRGGLQMFGTGAWLEAGTLTLYMLGFSFAYLTLDAGLGALILFGGVQLTMVAGAVLQGERLSLSRSIGTAIAFAGLMWLLWPAGSFQVPLVGAALMLAAALGWGTYSLQGRRVEDPLAATARAFVLASIPGLLAWGLVPGAIDGRGVFLACLSGVVTSGMGYALWYSVLPRLTATAAALTQLVVPVIATIGGVIVLSEDVTLRLVLASALVLGGVAFGIIQPFQRRGTDF